MPDRKKIILFTILNLIVINGALLAVLNLKYPMVGHDYNFVLPSIMDSALHVRLNGLKIQWFTPSFGGGIPAYPNPQNWEFSLTTLFMLFLPPWQAIMLTIVTYTSIGFIACTYLLRCILKFDWTASILGAVLFSVNGFMIDRVTVGHFGFITFSLLPLLLILFLDRSLLIGYASAIFGLLFASLIYFASYFIVIVFGLSILITLPLLYIYDDQLLNTKKILATLTLGGIIGGFISLSKLTAVYSFMRFFPRAIADEYDPRLWVGLFGILLQLMGTMNLVPLFLLAGLKPDTLPYFMPAESHHSLGLWEVDMSLSPIVFVFLLIGITKFLHNPKAFLPTLTNGRRKIAWLCFFLAIWLNIEFILARGLFYPFLDHLPIINSLHINVRFTAAMIFPIILVATLFYNRWSKHSSPTRVNATFITSNVVTLLFVGTYFLFKGDPMWRFFDASSGQKYYEQLQTGTSFEVRQIGLTKDNSSALLTGISNLNLYEAVFGYNMENYHPQIKAGPIWQISDGYYNMTDPTGFVFPEVNHNQPFDRFPLADKTNLELFAKHIQPNWKIPTYQRVADWVSGIACLAVVLYVTFQFIAMRRKTMATLNSDSYANPG